MPVTFPVDLKNIADLKQGLAPATYTTVTPYKGSAVDCLPYEGPMFAILSVGAVDFTTGNETYTFKIQESATTTDGDFGDLSGATFTYAAATDTTTSSNQTEIMNITGRTKRYVRAVLTTAGTTPSAIAEVTFLLRKKIAGGSGVKTSET